VPNDDDDDDDYDDNGGGLTVAESRADTTTLTVYNVHEKRIKYE
jgi:hypothetical protein